jgi:hypothetical protein
MRYNKANLHKSVRTEIFYEIFFYTFISIYAIVNKIIGNNYSETHNGVEFQTYLMCARNTAPLFVYMGPRAFSSKKISIVIKEARVL